MYSGDGYLKNSRNDLNMKLSRRRRDQQKSTKLMRSWTIGQYIVCDEL